MGYSIVPIRIKYRIQITCFVKKNLGLTVITATINNIDNNSNKNLPGPVNICSKLIFIFFMDNIVVIKIAIDKKVYK